MAAALLTAADTMVPPDLQAAIFSRVLVYDRALKERAGKTVTIGVAFVSSDANSRRVRQEMVAAFSGLEPRVQGLPTRLVPHPYVNAKRFSEWIDANDVDVLYVAPGFEDVLEELKAVVAEKRLVTLTPVRAYVERGLAIAVVAHANRPQLVVNVAATRAAGMDLDPKLLQLSELLK